MVSMVMSFCAVLFPRGVLDEILNLIESVSEDFPSYSCIVGIRRQHRKQSSIRVGKKTLRN